MASYMLRFLTELRRYSRRRRRRGRGPGRGRGRGRRAGRRCRYVAAAAASFRRAFE